MYVLNQHPLYTVVPPIARSCNQRIEIGETSCLITPSDPLAKILLPVPVNVGSSCFKVLIPKGERLPAEDTRFY